MFVSWPGIPVQNFGNWRAGIKPDLVCQNPARVSDPEGMEAVLLVRSVELRHTRAGATFLRLSLTDRSNSLAAVLWEADDEAVAAAQRGAAVHVVGRIEDHPRYGRQLTLDSLRAAREDEIVWDELVAGPSRPVAELEHDLEALVASVADDALRTLLSRLLDGRFRTAPAAKYNHHAYRCGLLEHSVQVAHLVSAAAAVFEGIDRDLAVTGALLHDIGKLEAYESENGCADLTDAGKLEGEIPLGYFRVRRELESLDLDAERGRALLHIILAHHGCLEYGSPVCPGTREAALVHAMDNVSGQMGTFDRLAQETPQGERWSRYDRVLGGAALVA
jgi:3'-5' exoribonuclease